MNMQEREVAKIHTEMLSLFRAFTVTHSVNYPDGRVGLVTYWVNIRAEDRYNKLQKEYDKLKGKEN